MSIKQEFIDYVESNFKTNPMSEELMEYWQTFKDASNINKPQTFTENGKKILIFLQDHQERKTWKAKDVADEMFLSSRSVSGAMRKLVTDGYVDKLGQDPVIYSLTDKGINIKVENDE